MIFDKNLWFLKYFAQKIPWVTLHMVGGQFKITETHFRNFIFQFSNPEFNLKSLTFRQLGPVWLGLRVYSGQLFRPLLNFQDHIQRNCLDHQVEYWPV